MNAGRGWQRCLGCSSLTLKSLEVHLFQALVEDAVLRNKPGGFFDSSFLFQFGLQS